MELGESTKFSRRYRPRTPYKVRLDDGQVRFLSADQFEELFGLQWEPVLAEPAARVAAMAKILDVSVDLLANGQEEVAAAHDERVEQTLMDIEPAPTVIGVDPWAWPVEWGLGEHSAPDPWAGSTTVKLENLVRQVLRGSEASVMGGTVIVRWAPKWTATAMRIPVAEVEDRARSLEEAGVLEPMEAGNDTRTDALWADVPLSTASLSALKDSLEGRGPAGRISREISVPKVVAGVVAPTARECTGLRLSLRPTSWPYLDGSDAGRAMAHILREAPVRIISGKVCSAVTADMLAKAIFNKSGKAARAALDALVNAGTLGPVDIDGQEVPSRFRELYPGLAVSAAELEAIAEAVISGRGYDPAEEQVAQAKDASAASPAEDPGSTTAAPSEETGQDPLLNFSSAPGVTGIDAWAWPVEWGLGLRSAPDPWDEGVTKKIERLLRTMLAGAEASVVDGRVRVRWSPRQVARIMGVSVEDVETRVSALESMGALSVVGTPYQTVRTDVLWAQVKLSEEALATLRDSLEGKGSQGRKPLEMSLPWETEGVVVPVTTECRGLAVPLRPTSWPSLGGSDVELAMAHILRSATVRVVSGAVCAKVSYRSVASDVFFGSRRQGFAVMADLRERGWLGPKVKDRRGRTHEFRQLFPGLPVTREELDAISSAVREGVCYDPAEDTVVPVAETMEESLEDVWSNDPKSAAGPAPETEPDTEQELSGHGSVGLSSESCAGPIADDPEGPEQKLEQAVIEEGSEDAWRKAPYGQLTIDLEGATEGIPTELSMPEADALPEVSAKSPDDSGVMVFDARRTFVGTMSIDEVREAFGDGFRMAGGVCQLLPIPEVPTVAAESSDPDWELAKGQALSLVEPRNRTAVEVVLAQILAGDLDLSKTVMDTVKENPRDFRGSTAVPEILSTPLSAKRFVSRVCHEVPYVTLAVAVLETLVAKGAVKATATAASNDGDIEALCLAWARDNVGAKNVFRKHAAQKILDGHWSLLLFEEAAAEAAKAAGMPAAHAPWDVTVVAMVEEGPTFAVAVINPVGGDPVTVAMGSLEKDNNAEAMALFMCGLVCGTGRRSPEESVGDPARSTSGAGDGTEGSVGYILVSPKNFSGGSRGPLGHPRMSPKAHIVRGHWRNQACGPAYSETRRIWISTFTKGENYGFARGVRVADRHRVWRVVLDDRALSVVA